MGDASIRTRWLVEGTAGPSTPLRFGRDDNSYFDRVRVPKKNCHTDKKVTTLGMTKNRGRFPLGFDAGGENCRSLGFTRDDKG